MKLTEGLGEFGKRTRGGGGRKPAWSLQELASKYGMTRQALTAFIRKNNGPKPAMRTSTAVTTGGCTWYEYESFCKWWDSLPDEVKP